MALVSGELLRWGRAWLHRDGEYFDPACDFSFKGALLADLPMMFDHSGYVFKHPASVLRGADGLLLLHNLDPALPVERAVLEQIRAGRIFLSPSPFAPGELGSGPAGVQRQRPATPQPIRWYPLKEASYTQQPAQGYLRPVQVLL